MCTDNIVIPGKVLPLIRWIPPSLYGEYRYIEDRYIGLLSHKSYCNFCRDIEYSSLYREYRYIEDRYIGVPLYLVNFSWTAGKTPVLVFCLLFKVHLLRVFLTNIQCQPTILGSLRTPFLT